MNFSLSVLTISNLFSRSPTLSVSSLSTYSCLAIQFLGIARHTSPFLFASKCPSTCNLKSSCFHQFLSSSISISSSIINSSRISYSSSSSLSVSCCSFSCISTTSDGGGIYVNSSSIYVSISSCSFFACNAYSGGGAEFTCLNSSVIFSTFDCCSSSSLGPAFQAIPSVNSTINSSVVVKCQNSTSYSSVFSIAVYAAKSSIFRLNSTKNLVQHVTAMCLWVNSASYVSYCNIESNWDYSAGGCNNCQYPGSFSFSQSNYINNTESGNTWGLFVSDRGVKSISIDGCVFAKNSFTIFVNFGSTNGGGVYPTMSNCVIDFSVSYITSCSTVSISVTSSASMLSINFLTMGECNSEAFTSKKGGFNPCAIALFANQMILEIV